MENDFILMNKNELDGLLSKAIKIKKRELDVTHKEYKSILQEEAVKLVQDSKKWYTFKKTITEEEALKRLNTMSKPPLIVEAFSDELSKIRNSLKSLEQFKRILVYSLGDSFKCPTSDIKTIDNILVKGELNG